MVLVRWITAAMLLLISAAAFAAVPADRVLTILNRARLPIQELYVSDASSDDWGDERLGDTEIAPARSTTLRLGRSRDCTIDIRIVFADDSVEERHGFDVCRTRQVMFDGSTAEILADHRVSVANNAARPVRELYIVSGQADGWGEDLLPETGLPPEKTATVSFHGKCRADVRVVFDNDGAEERTALDLCTHPALTIVPGWATAE